MPRPSRNLDRALLAAGRELLPRTGCAGLTIRQVADAAGVNIGMFHYHFKTREAFLRAVMLSTYEEMYQRFVGQVAKPADFTPVEQLRTAFRVIARFVRDNHLFIGRIWADAMCGEAVARDFLRESIPRHGAMITALLFEGQRAGLLRPMPVPQALAFCMGAIGAPTLFGGAMVDGGELPKALARAIAKSVLSDAALDERIDLALVALAVVPGQTARAKPRAPRRKEGS